MGAGDTDDYIVFYAARWHALAQAPHLDRSFATDNSVATDTDPNADCSIVCNITAQRFFLGLRGEPPVSRQPSCAVITVVSLFPPLQLLDGSLFLPVDPDESTWESTSGAAGALSGAVVITLHKKLHREWPQILAKNEASGAVVVVVPSSLAASQPAPKKIPAPSAPPPRLISPGEEATASQRPEPHNKRWENFDLDEAVTELENEGIKDENEVTWKVNSGGSGITCEDYKKTKEEVELDREIAEKMGSLKVDCNRKMTDAARHKELGNECLKKGKPEEAFSQYKKGIALLDFLQYSAPVMAQRMREMVTQLQVDLNNNAAQAAIKLEEWELAAACADKALKVQPENVKAAYRLGVARQSQGDLDSARKQMKKVLQLDPKNKAAAAALEGLAAGGQ